MTEPTDPTEASIELLRQQLDALDEELMARVAARMDIVAQIGEALATGSQIDPIASEAKAAGRWARQSGASARFRRPKTAPATSQR